MMRAPALCALFALALHPLAVYGDEKTYYMAVNGDDATGDGSAAKPFATINGAFGSLGGGVCGSTLRVQAGVYVQSNQVENVMCGSSPWTITAEDGADVRFEGREAIADIAEGAWEQVPGQPYWKATLTKDVTQVWVDDQLMTVARHPNVDHDWADPWPLPYTAAHPPNCSFYNEYSCGWLNLDEAKRSTVNKPPWEGKGGSTVGKLADTSFAGKDFVTGGGHILARVCSGGAEYVAGPITKHFGDTLEWDYGWNVALFFGGMSSCYKKGKMNMAVSGRQRVVVEAFGALDKPKEYWYNHETRDLHFIPPQGADPNTLAVTGKTQDWAMLCVGCTGVSVKGLSFFGTAVRATAMSSQFELRDNAFVFPTWNKYLLGDYTKQKKDDSRARDFSAFHLYFESAALVNNTFKYIESGIQMLGSEKHVAGSPSPCIVQNNLIETTIHGKALELTDCLGGSVMHNTIHLTQFAGGIRYGSSISGTSMEVGYNHISDLSSARVDASGIQSLGHAVEGLVSHHAWIHSGHSKGIRMDTGGMNGTVHHVVVYDNEDGMNLKGDYMKFMYNLGFLNGDKNDMQTEYCEIHHRQCDPKNIYNLHSQTFDNMCSYLGGAKTDCKKEIRGNHGTNWNGCDTSTDGHHATVTKHAEDYVRDAWNYDFRLKATTTDAIDAATSFPGIDDAVVGSRPDIGAYEFGAAQYWIPGRVWRHASSPVPPMHTRSAQADLDLMWLAGAGAESHDVYFGTDAKAVFCAGASSPEYVGNYAAPGNIATPPTTPQAGVWYYWRVDVVAGGAATRAPQVFCFQTGEKGRFLPVIPEPASWPAPGWKPDIAPPVDPCPGVASLTADVCNAGAY
eukprot:TRINITY_DN3363_c0_g2_i1.p1 TRINITY_DN3363_c0_g2~~TRINITY_DN3363_c0_g2_i1.p1  ORF type:complete len:848 (+),score=343.77 TRINITY_DN3363_c0_g2_i1:63-2606(+)